jgi:quercetin dioxygenase-like cupin family protein
MGKPQMPADVERLTRPTVIKAADAPRFLWGDPEAGFVSDWIHGSSLKIHMMSFSMAVGQKFVNSPDFKTYYDCAETYYCQKGEFTFHCPETGEVQVIKAGEFLYIPPRTWHFGYNFGREECRITEIITPPVRERIEDFSARHELGAVKQVLDGVIGGFAGSAAGLATRSRVVRPEDYLHELVGREKPIRVGLVCSTDLLTTGVVELYPGQASEPLAHPGDKVVFVLEGMLNVRVWPTEEWWELHAGDTCFVPEACSHSFQNCMDQRVKLMFGVAPRYR